MKKLPPEDLNETKMYKQVFLKEKQHDKIRRRTR